MKITDKNVSFVLFFIPFLFIQSIADWGTHGQRVRTPEYSKEYADTLATKSTTQGGQGSSASASDFTSDQIYNPEIEKSSADSGVAVIPGDSAFSGKDTVKSKSTLSGASVYNASIIDYHGKVIHDGTEPIAAIKRFRGTVVPGGDTIHFRIPVYGSLSLENIEFSGVVYNERDIQLATNDFENPYSFSSGLWMAILSLGGIFSSVAFTEPALSEKTYSTEMITLMVCGYIASGVGQYFGVDKMVKHFRWKNQFRNRLSLNN